MVKSIRALVQKLPPHYKYCLRSLVELFVAICNKSIVNMMNAQNIALVFTPSLLRSQLSFCLKNVGNDFRDEGFFSGKTFGIVENLIYNYDAIFQVPKILSKRSLHIRI